MNGLFSFLIKRQIDSIDGIFLVPVRIIKAAVDLDFKKITCIITAFFQLFGSLIFDTPVTLAAKSHLRNERPILIAVSTNDALSTAASNIGRLMNNRNVYFVPMKQDDSDKKPRSVVADFDKTFDAINNALEQKQIQPIFI